MCKQNLYVSRADLFCNCRGNDAILGAFHHRQYVVIVIDGETPF
jgi:hypothetical protein